MKEGWEIRQFEIVMPPRGQARARANVLMDRKTGVARIDAKSGRAIIIHHKSKEQETDERKLEALLFEHRPERPYEGPILLGVRAYMEIPKSKSKRFRSEALEGQIRPVGKPDLSNIVKHIEDVANGVFWHDDKQIVGVIGATGKYYAEYGHYEIVIGYRRELQVEADDKLPSGAVESVTV